MSASIIFDGECPVCSRYVRYLRLGRAAGQVDLIDARLGGPEVEDARRKGFKLDEGFVLKLNDQYFHGAEAMTRLALMSTPVGLLNRINHAVFQSPAMSRLAYPFLRAGRNVLLRVLQRDKLGY